MELINQKLSISPSRLRSLAIKKNQRKLLDETIIRIRLGMT
uniref:Uncharacterized protein n=1 Tax=Rhizophora mucronata TaxID=61149 RepID=A0A2P2MP19_RHIMU